MGASLLAFTPTRYAVMAEGGSDAVLLPTMLREATGEVSLGYQVVPGLAEVAPRAVRNLALDAARVVFLVDGDAAGRGIAKILRRARVPDKLILTLGAGSSGWTIEDLVGKLAYRTAVNEVLRLSHGDGVSISIAEIPDQGRALAVSKWCGRRHIDPPSKVAVASVLVDLGREQPIVMSSRKRVLRQLHQEIRSAFA